MWLLLRILQLLWLVLLLRPLPGLLMLLGCLPLGLLMLLSCLPLCLRLLLFFRLVLLDSFPCPWGLRILLPLSSPLLYVQCL